MNTTSQVVCAVRDGRVQEWLHAVRLLSINTEGSPSKRDRSVAGLATKNKRSVCLIGRGREIADFLIDIDCGLDAYSYDP